MIRTTLSLLALFALAACGNEGTEISDGDAGPAQNAMEQAQEVADKVSSLTIATPEVHDAMCGCSIESVGHCGNYVKLGEKWVELEWSELGHMEWCGKKEAGARIEIAGAMDGDKFVATSYREVE